MKKSIYSVLTALLIAVLTVSPALAAKISGSMGLGSIKFIGWAAGFSRQDVIFTLDATGIPEVTCYNNGNDVTNAVPGQNPVEISATGFGTSDTFILDEKGKYVFDEEQNVLEADIDLGDYSAKELGCPNDNWRAEVTFVFWNWAQLTVTDYAGNILYQKASDCEVFNYPADPYLVCSGFSK